MRSQIPLSLGTTTFTDGSWGEGLVFEAAGFTPNDPIDLALAEWTAPGKGTITHYTINADPQGNLDSVWIPTTPPTAPDSSGYPTYAVYAYQNPIGNGPVLTTTLIPLTITPDAAR